MHFMMKFSDFLYLKLQIAFCF